jgi:hypothetical protein
MAFWIATGHFPGFTCAKTYATFTIADHGQSGKAELTPAFNNFGDASYADEFFQKIIAFRLRIVIRHDSAPRIADRLHERHRRAPLRDRGN